MVQTQFIEREVVKYCCFIVFVCAVFAEFSFCCTLGLTNALEQDGFISGFMDFYLRTVREPAESSHLQEYLSATFDSSV